MKISMVIPTYTLNDRLEELAEFAIHSYRKEVDQLIVTEDGGKYSQTLHNLADLYLYSKENVGFTKNVNRGWRLAEGDYVMIVNSDTMKIEGNLANLCVPNTVTSPITHSEYVPYLWGAFFCVPKEVTQALGYLLEDMRMFSSDAEYDHRVRSIFETVRSVEIFHSMGATRKHAKIPLRQEEKDRKVYARLVAEGRAAYSNDG